MAQEIERVHDRLDTPADEHLTPVVKSHPENGRKQHGQTLKQKAEEEQEKARRKNQADSLVLTGDDDRSPDESDDSPRDRDNDESPQTGASEAADSTDKDGIDLKA